jgi:hypothetical protein
VVEISFKFHEKQLFLKINDTKLLVSQKEDEFQSKITRILSKMDKVKFSCVFNIVS